MDLLCIETMKGNSLGSASWPPTMSGFGELRRLLAKESYFGRDAPGELVQQQWRARNHSKHFLQSYLLKFEEGW